MYYIENGELVSISYADWLRECIELQNAFVITPSPYITDEDERIKVLEKLGCFLDKRYPDRKKVRYFPLVKYLGHYLYSNEVGIAIRDVDPYDQLNSFILDETIEQLTNSMDYIFSNAFDYKADNNLYLLSLPCGLTTDRREIF